MLKRIAFVLSILLLIARVSSSAPGDLDSTFGNDGVITYEGAVGIEYWDYGSGGVAVQSDEKIVVVTGSSSGGILTLRYNGDGTLDNTFNGEGAVIHYGRYDDTGYGVAIQSDEKIVVVGKSNGGVVVLRYNIDGTLDTTFDNDGVAVYGGDYGKAVALQSDGKIVVVGSILNFLNDNMDVLVLRYNSNGTLDTTFDGDGVVTYNGTANSHDDGYGVAIQPDGKIVVIGKTCKTPSEWDLLILRYNSDGTLDSTFGKSGVVTYHKGLTTEAFGVAIQPDCKIVVAGTVYNAINHTDDILILRYKCNGTLDTTFGGDGLVTYHSDVDQGKAVAIQADGKILVVGNRYHWGEEDVVVVRYNNNGILDGNFGLNGLVVYDSGMEDYISGIAIQEDGKIVVTGVTGNNMLSYDVLTMRLHGGDPDETPPTPNPMTWETSPYQTGINSISMVATTATDPAPPISYYFDFVGSPTGGLGGKDSGWQPGTSYTNSKLRANHKYGYRVKARDGLNNQTAYSTTQYAYTPIQAPAGITFGTVTPTSIQVRSTNTPTGLSRGKSGLLIENTTNGDNSGWKRSNSPWTSKSLTPNTSYSFQAKTRNGDAIETEYASASQYTRANLPGQASFSDVTGTSIRANWTDNGNPGGTQYLCQNVTTKTDSGWITETYWDSNDLALSSSYSFRVKARNDKWVETGWTSLGKQSTAVVVVKPNGEEMISSPSNYDITWTAYETTQPITKVQLSYTKDAGVTWNSIPGPSGTTYPPGEYSQSWKVPPVGTTPKTKCKVKVVLKDAKGVIQGSDVSDNFFTIKPLVPDLIETSVSDPPATALPGSSFSVTDTVENQGDANAGLSTTRYYLSVDTSKDAGDFRLEGTRSVPALVPGATSSGTVDVTIPSSIAAGAYYLLACADDKNNKVAESNEKNNCVASTSTMQVTRPDLVETSVTKPPATALPGSIFSVTDTVENQGDSDAGPSTTRYYLSVNTTWGAGDIRLEGTRSVPGLAAGEFSTGTVEVTIPSGLAAGSYYLLACADDLAAVAESNEKNNCIASTSRVQINGPDLIETSVTNPPTAVKAGMGFRVTDTVKNQGNVNAEPSVTQYYLSKNTFKDSGDVFLTGGRYVVGLAPGETSTDWRGVDVTVPSGTAEGAYYLLACADDMEAVDETDDTNNCIASDTTVQVVP